MSMTPAAANAPVANNNESPGKNGVTTTPELAAFANSVLIRMTDYNDHGPAGHASDLLPAAFSVGEAVHATGMQVLMGIAVGYEVRGVNLGGSREAMAAAMAAGKVLGLDEDRLSIRASGQR